MRVRSGARRQSACLRGPCHLRRLQVRVSNELLNERTARVHTLVDAVELELVVDVLLLLLQVNRAWER